MAAAPTSPPVRVVDDGGASAAVRLPLGGELAVELGSNRTTGYAWRLVSADPARLRLKSHRYRPSTGQGGAPRLGAGGTDVFTFEPVAAGGETLRFEYRRGEGGEPARTYRLAVTIVP